MIARTFTDEALVFRHTPPALVRALGAFTLFVNGGMVAAGAALLQQGALFGVVLALLGALGVVFAVGMIFGARRVRIDREAIRETWSLVLPLYTRTTRVADLRALVLARTYRRVKYSVVVMDQLLAASDTGKVALLSTGDPAFGSDVETITRFLALPVRDERTKDVRKMVRDTQLRALPVALAIAIVLVCVAGTAAFTIVMMTRGPVRPRDEPAMTPLSGAEMQQSAPTSRPRANQNRRRSVSGR